jgi:hypothetical protein
MKMILLPLLNGLELAIVWAVVVHASGARRGVWMHAAMLLLAALFYLSFAAWAGDAGGMLLESLGVLAFGAVAYLAVRRRSTTLVALGWALHPLWDVALHTTGAGAAYTPAGYVVACIGFDLLLAAMIVRGWAVGREESVHVEAAPCR